jgi:integrase
MSEEKTKLLPHFYFKYEGKEYKCFKRLDDRDAPYYFEMERAGKRTKRCLETNVQENAITQAKKVIDMVKGERWAELEALKLRGAPVQAEAATIGDVVLAYERIAKPYQKERTIAGNINALRVVVREGLGKPELEAERVDAMSTAALTGAIVSAFERGRLVAAGSVEVNRQSALTTVESYLRQARVIFKERWLREYRRAGVSVPDLEEFLTEDVMKSARKVKEAPPAELVAKTFTEVEKLRTTDEDAYIVFLMAACSLRRGEIQRARPDWLQEHAGKFVFRIDPNVTKSKVVRIVPVPSMVAAQIKDYLVRSLSSRPEWDRDYIIPCKNLGQGGPNAKSRAQNVCKRVNAFMRSMGWTTRKTLHEMRALYLRMLRQKYGMEVAQEVGGHADPRTTRNNYTGLLDLSSVVIDVQLPGALAIAAP